MKREKDPQLSAANINQGSYAHDGIYGRMHCK